MKPEKTIRAGAISVSIWNNETDKGAFKTVQLQRSYKDPEGNWKHSSNLRMSDLPKATLVLNKAYEYLAMSEEASS